MKFENCSKIINNKLIVNTTPHGITFDVNGDTVIVPNDASALLNAKVVEEVVSDDLVRSTFVGTEEGAALISEIQKWAEETHPGVTLRIIGSIIAAQAFPGSVVGMTPAPGFERVPPQEKRMNPSKFTTFQK